MRLWLLAKLALVIPIVALAEDRSPTEKEAAATYCLAISDREVDLARRLERAASTVPEDKRQAVRDWIEEVRRDNLRLKLYILPKILELSVDEMAAVGQRGEADLKQALTDTESCQAACTDLTPAQQRVNACKSLFWLPSLPP